VDGDGNVFVVDEHAERLWLPQRHAKAIEAMLARHQMSGRLVMRGQPRLSMRIPLEQYGRPLQLSDLERFVAGTDVFSHQYRRAGIRLTPANTDRVNGWAAILQRFGDVDGGLRPSLFIHKRCARLIECVANLQHDPGRPEDVLKTDVDEGGLGGDDAADALRYLIATKSNKIYERRLTGL
jgi:hypothetical protein